MPSNSAYACFRCRIAWKAGPTHCTRCGVAATYMGTRWRAPKQHDLKAWKAIANGNVWWDHKARAKSKRIQQNERWRDMWLWKKLRQKPGSKL